MLPDEPVSTDSYSTNQVARMLDLPAPQIRSWAKAGIVQPSRGLRKELRFGFQDLVVLRAAKRLSEASESPKKVKQALAALKLRLPSQTPLSSYALKTVGTEIVVQEGQHVYLPESGQTVLPFDAPCSTQDPKKPPESLQCTEPEHALKMRHPVVDAEQWFILGTEWEVDDLYKAEEAYEQAVTLDPTHAEAQLNLGRLLHERGELPRAVEAYRAAWNAAPDLGTAAFNLAVALEDLGHIQEAIETYKQTIEIDPHLADAFFNLARIYETMGQHSLALRCLRIYRKLNQ